MGPDTIVAVCPYCGKPNWIRGSPSKLLTARVPSRGEAEEFFRRLVERDPDLSKLRPRLLRVEAVLLPFYRVRGRLEASFEATVVLTVSVERVVEGRSSVEYRSVAVRVSDSFGRGFEALVLGRRGVAESRPVVMLADRLWGARLEPFERVSWERGFHEALAVEVEGGEAGAEAAGAACREARRVAERLAAEEAEGEYLGEGVVVSSRVADMRFSCSPRVERVEGPFYAPLVRAYYSVSGRVYRAYFAWDGTPLYREEPMTLGQRLAAAALASLLSGAGGAAAPLAALLLGGVKGLVAGAALFALSALAGYRIFNAALQPSRVEEGVESWVESIVAAVKGGG